MIVTHKSDISETKTKCEIEISELWEPQTHRTSWE
jgi:hypothetical protein